MYQPKLLVKCMSRESNVGQVKDWCSIYQTKFKFRKYLFSTNFQPFRSSYQIIVNMRIIKHAWIKCCPCILNIQCISVQIDIYGLYLYQIQSLHLGIPDRDKKPHPFHRNNPFYVPPKCERRLRARSYCFLSSLRVIESTEWWVQFSQNGRLGGIGESHRAGLVEVAPVAPRQLNWMGRLS